MLKFFRGTAHVVSIVTLLGLCVTAQSKKPQRQSPHTQREAATDIRGTDQSPLAVKVLPTAKTPEETAQEKADRKDVSDANWSMVYVNRLIFGLGVLQLAVFGYQAYMLRKNVRIVDAIAEKQGVDMVKSIAEATRAATAMEGVSAAMTSSVEISKRNSRRLKIITELGNRAYVAVNFNDAKPQDAANNFEIEAQLLVHGNTPAYDVTFKAAIDVVKLPFDPNFAFPLDDPQNVGISSSFIAPRTPAKLIVRTLRRVPDNEVEAIKRGFGKGLLFWGIVEYKDAFKKQRFVKFAFFVHWLKWAPGKDVDEKGNPKPEISRSADTQKHNEAN